MKFPPPTDPCIICGQTIREMIILLPLGIVHIGLQPVCLSCAKQHPFYCGRHHTSFRLDERDGMIRVYCQFCESDSGVWHAVQNARTITGRLCRALPRKGITALCRFSQRRFPALFVYDAVAAYFTFAAQTLGRTPEALLRSIEAGGLPRGFWPNSARLVSPRPLPSVKKQTVVSPPQLHGQGGAD